MKSILLSCCIHSMILGLSIPMMYGQSFLDIRHFGIGAEYGYGKIQYYNDYTPAYVIGSDDHAHQYSPSYQIEVNGSWWLSPMFDFSLSMSHLTVTEKYENNLTPDWEGIGEDHLIQGFLHLTPGIKIKLPEDRFTIDLGIRLGTANLFGNTTIQGSSNSLGSLHADFGIESGFTILCSRKIAFEACWIEGLSKYDYTVSMPITSINYFKYRSFLFGINYLMYAK